MKKKLDKKGPLIAQLQCSLSKIEMAATPAPSNGQRQTKNVHHKGRAPQRTYLFNSLVI